MSITVVHGGLAAVTAAAALALFIVAGVAYFRSSTQAVALVLLVRRVALVAAVLAALVGALMLATGKRPHEGLHILYGALAVAAVPVAASMAARNPRTGAIYHLGAGLLLLALCARLLSTG